MKFQLTGTDAMNSVLNQRAADGEYQQQSFSPYGGYATVLAKTPGFNGERRDPLTGTTHLGNGYRAYNPTLMRFHCPDSISPFGDAGINSYAYCDDDPINNSDPSGHIRIAQKGAPRRGLVGRRVADVIPGVDMAISAVRGVVAGIESAGASVSTVEGIQGARASKSLKRSKKMRASGGSGQAKSGISGSGIGNSAKKMRTAALKTTQDTRSTNMMDLPNEMLLNIASFLPRDESVGRLNQVNRRLRDVTMDMRLTSTEHVIEHTRNIPYVMSERQDRYFSSLASGRQNAVRLQYQVGVCRLNLPGPSYSRAARTQLSSISSSYYEGMAENIFEDGDMIEYDLYYAFQQTPFWPE